jgi:hypothetical protein
MDQEPVEEEWWQDEEENEGEPMPEGVQSKDALIEVSGET